MFEVSVQETFAAGHALRNYHGKCENVHGHNYRVRITLEGPDVDPHTGLLIDFVEMKKVLRKTIAYLDHQFINDLPPFTIINPSAENIAKYFADEMQAGLKYALEEASIRIRAVQVWETDTCVATYRP